MLEIKGWIDAPNDNEVIYGEYIITGWCLDYNGVESIGIYIDGELIGNAYYGDFRQGVYEIFPEYNCLNSGFNFKLNSSKIDVGIHELIVREHSKSGADIILGEKNIVIEHRKEESLNFESLQIFLNDVCNYKCPSCPLSVQEKPKLYFDDIDCESLFADINIKDLKYISFTSRGEPLLSYNIMIKIMKFFLNKKPNIEFRTITNGSLLSKEKFIELRKLNLSAILLSVDGWGEECYAVNRHSRNGRNYFNHIKEVIEFTKEIPVTINFVPLKENIRSIPEMINEIMKYPLINMNLLYLLHPDLWFEDAAKYVGGFEETNSIFIPKYRQFYATNLIVPEMLEIARDLYKKYPNRICFSVSSCAGLVNQLTINLNGDITPCCYAPLAISNIKNDGYIDCVRKLRDYQESLRLNKNTLHKNCIRCLEICASEQRIRLKTISEIANN